MKTLDHLETIAQNIQKFPISWPYHASALYVLAKKLPTLIALVKAAERMMASVKAESEYFKNKPDEPDTERLGLIIVERVLAEEGLDKALSNLKGVE